MKTDREILNAFKKQFEYRTGSLFNELQVLILMGMARGEERRLSRSGESKSITPYQCPHTEEGCIMLDTTGPDMIRPCDECPNNEVRTIVMKWINGKTLFSVQYHGYSADEWTVPVLLTQPRAERFLEDASVKTIKLFINDKIKILVP